MEHAFLQGTLLGLGLIVAIGAQNIFVLKQGLLRQHVFWVALICTVCDIVLMGAGVFGVGTLLSQNATLTRVLAFLGAAFVVYYGLRAWRSAWVGSSGMHLDGSAAAVSVKRVVLITLAITLLNPHVYVDTLLLVGGIAATYEEQHKLGFWLGTSVASIVWFFSLAYGAVLLSPWLRSRGVWRVIDTLIGVFMMWIGWYLLQYGITSV